MDWPTDPRSKVTASDRAILLQRLRRTVRELQELGFPIPAELMRLVAKAPDAPGEGAGPTDKLPL